MERGFRLGKDSAMNDKKRTVIVEGEGSVAENFFAEILTEAG